MVVYALETYIKLQYSVEVFTTKEAAIEEAKRLVNMSKYPMRKHEETNYWDNETSYISVVSKILRAH